MMLTCPSQVWFLRGLLLLTLMLATVCGIPMKTPSSSSPKQAKENVQAGVDQQPKEMARSCSTCLSDMEHLESKFLDDHEMISDDTDPIEYKSLGDKDDNQHGDKDDNQHGSAEEKPEMKNWDNQWLNLGIPVIDIQPDEDTCEKWLSCNGDFFSQYLKSLEQDLPNCPCVYPPFAIHHVVSVFDERLGRSFQWKDASDPEDLMHIYHPSASLCLRSLLTENSSSIAAQHCCYDGSHRLITRGKGAATPTFISSDFSPQLHFIVERFPWVFCKGNWSRYHKVLPPNNGLSCRQRPSQKIYQAQLREANES